MVLHEVYDLRIFATMVNFDLINAKVLIMVYAKMLMVL